MGIAFGPTAIVESRLNPTSALLASPLIAEKLSVFFPQFPIVGFSFANMSRFLRTTIYHSSSTTFPLKFAVYLLCMLHVH